MILNNWSACFHRRPDASLLFLTLPSAYCFMPGVLFRRLYCGPLPKKRICFLAVNMKTSRSSTRRKVTTNGIDVKFSLKPAGIIPEENRRLIEKNETYKAVIGKLNRQIAALQKKVVDPKGVRKLARDVRAEYTSKKNRIGERLKPFYGCFDAPYLPSRILSSCSTIRTDASSNPRIGNRPVLWRRTADAPSTAKRSLPIPNRR